MVLRMVRWHQRKHKRTSSKGNRFSAGHGHKKILHPLLSRHKDTDKDGVSDAFDCQPYNQYAQDDLFWGHCQVCGRRQAVRARGLLANHGYTVPGWGEGGYFQGICRGADHLPIEKDKSIAEETIRYLESEIPELKSRANRLESGKEKPATIAYTTWNYITGKRDPMVAKRGDKEYPQQLKELINKIRENARQYESIVESVKELIRKYYGKSLDERPIGEALKKIQISTREQRQAERRAIREAKEQKKQDYKNKVIANRDAHFEKMKSKQLVLQAQIQVDINDHMAFQNSIHNPTWVHVSTPYKIEDVVSMTDYNKLFKLLPKNVYKSFTINGLKNSPSFHMRDDGSIYISNGFSYDDNYKYWNFPDRDKR